MTPLARAYARYERALAAYQAAHQSLAEDRNQKSGDLYEAQQALNAAVRDHLAPAPAGAAA